MNELKELDLGIHMYYCAITQMVSMNELNGLDLEFFAACSNNLTLDYNIRKAVHHIYIQIYIHIYRNFVVYNATVGLAQARPNKERRSHESYLPMSNICKNVYVLMITVSKFLLQSCRQCNTLLYIIAKINLSAYNR